MHYKNLAFAALAGIVLLSSCVKDLETKSVTDIRNAKLEEIKSQTALNNAKAASEKTLSEAEALLKAAQADAQKANAEHIRAQAEYQQAVTAGILLDNQQKAAELEAALIQAEISKAKAQAELERLAMDLERQLLNAQAQLLQAMTIYENAKNTRLSSLANAYTSATITLLTAQKDLVGLKAQLTSAEEELVDLQTSQEKLIADNNAKIAVYEKVVAAYREHMGMTEEELAAKRAELNSLMQEKYVLYANANDIYTDAEAKLCGYYDENGKFWNGARTDFDDTYYLIKNPGNAGFALDANTEEYSFYAPILRDPSGDPNWEGIRTYSFNYYDVDGNSVETPVVNVPEYYCGYWDGEYKYTDYEAKYWFETVEDGKNSEWYYPEGYRTYGKAEILDPDAPATVAAVAKEKIAKQHEENVAGIQTSINENTAMVAVYEKAVSEYEAKTKDLYNEKEELEEKLEKAYAAADKAEIPYMEYLAVHYTELYAAVQALNKAEEVRDGITGKIDDIKDEIIETKGDINDYEEEVASATGNVKSWKGEVETATNAVKNAQTAYDTQAAVVAPLLDALNAKAAAERKAKLEWLAGTGTYEAYYAAMQATAEALDAWSGPNTLLEAKEVELNTAKTMLTIYQGYLENAEGAKVRNEGWLDSYKKKLASLESDLAKLESNLTDAEKAVKAAEEAKEAAIAKVDTSEEYLALVKAVDEAYTECGKLEDSIDEVEGKIAEIEGTDEDPGMVLEIAYSYDDLCLGRLINGTELIYKYSVALDKLSDYEGDLEEVKDELADDETSFDDFNKQVDEWLEKVTAIVESEASYSADVDALNELEKTTLELYKELRVAGNAYNEVLAEITALDRMVEDNIDYYLDMIEDLKEENADIAKITTKEQLIAELKVKIANKEAEVEVYKKIADDAKAALDAALAEEENTTEE